jgi:hypothetical protein
MYGVYLSACQEWGIVTRTEWTVSIGSHLYHSLSGVDLARRIQERDPTSLYELVVVQLLVPVRYLQSDWETEYPLQAEFGVELSSIKERMKMT